MCKEESLDEELKKCLSELAKLKDFITHQYEKVDYGMVWNFKEKNFHTLEIIEKEIKRRSQRKKRIKFILFYQ